EDAVPPPPPVRPQERAPEVAPEPAARRFVLTPPTSGRQVEIPADHKATVGEAAVKTCSSAAPVATVGPPAAMHEELAAIRSMVGQVLQQQRRAPGAA